MNDRSESAAMHAVFGARVKDVAVSSTKSSMGHLIAAAGAVEVAVCALAIRHEELPINANLRELDPDCALNARARRARAAAGAHRDVQFVRLRRLEQLRRAARASRRRRRRACRHDGRCRGTCTMSERRVVITGTGAVCAAGRDPAAILEAVRDGRSAIAPIRQWDTARWPMRVAGEIADFNARDLVDDRKLHKLIRRTDLLGLYAADRAIDAAGLAAHRGGARRPGRGRVQRSHRGLRRLRRRQLREPVRLSFRC